MEKIKIIAYYLPQFHPFKQNNEWWGKGFTEWTNVAKAKPLFKGHYQPKIPSDLGFYDLRLPEVREEQVQLAKEAGVYGFCYWHYWFNGTELMERPFKEVLLSGKPDFPFCLGWANESWMAKLWSKNGVTGKTLIEQTYSSEDDVAHFEAYKVAFQDQRYIRIDDKPFFLIYRPLDMPDVKQFMQTWNKLISTSGIAEGFYFVAHARNEEECDILRNMGFDAVNIGPTTRCRELYKGFSKARIINKVKRIFTGCPNMVDYKHINEIIWEKGYEDKEDVLPTLIPNWDHSPRGGKNSLVFNHCTPELWREQADKVISLTKQKRNKVIMLKSWNEWGEGNYMEPDLKYGKENINILSETMNHTKKM